MSDATFDAMWSAIAGIGRDPSSGGYRRFAWTDPDLELREWFTGEAAARGLDLVEDRMGNQWAWWGDPDQSPGVVTGSHLDSVPDGGAFDGPLGVVSAFAAIDALRARGFRPGRPIGVVNFVDEEGARFGVACAGSRVITGVLPAERALALTDASGRTMAEALRSAGRRPEDCGPDPETLGRIGQLVELHVEQGRALIDRDRAIGLASDIWPHGRWRIDVPGVANHAGTTRLADRQDALLGCAQLVLSARSAAEAHGCLATMGKLVVEPGGVNAIPSHVTAWLDARGAEESDVTGTVEQLTDGRRRARRGRDPRVVDPQDHVRSGPDRAAQRRARPAADPRYRCRARRRNPRQRGDLDGDDLRPEPDRGIALAGRVGRARRLPGRSRRVDRRARRPDGAGAMIRYWAEHAWLPDGCRSGVSFAVDQDRFAEVRTGTEPSPDHRRLPGVVLPGLANGHSHAFHRALRGRTHEGGGTFWTWREEMYAVAARLDPDSYFALARQVYAEMVEAGYTCVGEFHYLHHDRDGRAYADPNAMGAALIAAAAEVGIRLTLLDTCYLAGGLDDHGHRELDPVQRRYSDGSVERWAERVALLEPTATVRIGAAVHSVRAVPGAALASIKPTLGDRPLHVHLSEQPAENAATLAYYGCTPTALLDTHGLLGERTTAVHATHLSDADIDRARRHPDRGLCLPDHRARPRRRHRPVPPARRRREPVDPRLGPARGDRPVRGVARSGDARATVQRPARSLHAGGIDHRRERCRLSQPRLGIRRRDPRRGAGRFRRRRR